MEVGRGFKEGRPRCQEPIKMIFSLWSWSMPTLHPAHSVPFCQISVPLAMHTLSITSTIIGHIALSILGSRKSVGRCIHMRCIGMSFFFGIHQHLEAESTTEDFLFHCFASSYSLARRCLGGARDLSPRALAVRPFATKLASIAIVI